MPTATRPPRNKAKAAAITSPAIITVTSKRDSNRRREEADRNTEASPERSYGNDPLPISIHEMRRRAPLHYQSIAQNTRFVAYALWVLDKDAQERSAKQIGYGGSTSTSLGEAFFREASLSLELIIKAVIALRIEVRLAQPHVVKVRPVHDLVSLWSDAGLPRLPPDDLHRLMIAKRILNWSGRYAAPRKDEQADREREEMAPLEDKAPIGSRLKAIRLRSFRWDDFDRIYQVAATSFDAIYPA